MHDPSQRPRDEWPGRALVVPLALGAGLLGLAAVAAAVLDEPFRVFVQDPATAADGPPYAGVLSQVGGLALWTGGTLCLLAGHLVSSRPRLALGALTLVVALDDLLLLHEGLLPYVRVPQELVIALYLAGTALVVARFRAFILRETPWPLAALAGGLLAVSLVLDVAGDLRETYHPLFEDGAKLLGILVWTTYLVLVSRPAFGRG